MPLGMIVDYSLDCWYGRAQPTMGRPIPSPVVFAYVRKQAETEPEWAGPESEPEKAILFQVSVLNSCSDFH